jgi:ATP-dependent RNA helicase SUPV3L1/SUV3
MVEVWRPGGRSEERRPRHDRNRHRHQDRAAEGTQPVAAAGEAGEAAKHQRHRRGRRERNNDFRKPRTDAPVEGVTAAAPAEGAPVREPREDKGRPPRERFEGRGQGRDQARDKDKFGGGRDKGGRDKGGREHGGRDKGNRDKGGRDSGPSHRQYATSAAPRERERAADPNSPFAKLAVLKEQLTANRKDQR